MDIYTRFWSKVAIGNPNDCWEWQASRNKDGYGKFDSTNSHRVAWKLTYGEIPHELFVCHKCDNPPCCNPNHLFVGTAAINNLDMKIKGRSRGGRLSGEDHPKSKLTNEQVKQIKTMHANGLSDRKIARQFGVVQTTISAIVTGRSWKQIVIND